MSEHHPMSEALSYSPDPFIADVAAELDRMHAELQRLKPIEAAYEECKNTSLVQVNKSLRGDIRVANARNAELEAENERLRAIEQAARKYRSECADHNPCPDYMLRSIYAKDLDAALAAKDNA